MWELVKRAKVLYGDIYAAVYSWNRKQWPADELWAAHLASLGISGAMLANLMVLTFIYTIVAGPPLQAQGAPALLKGVVVLICLLVVLANDAFVTSGRYSDAFERFSKRRPAAQRQVANLAWSYVITSYVLPAPCAVVLIATLR